MSHAQNLASLPVVTVTNGKPTVLSTDVARHFDKRHDHVLRDIENLRAQLEEKRLPNFGETVIQRENPSGGEPITSRAYHLTRDGFTLLAMGYTGKKALQFKLAYIDAFNKMEAQLQAPTFRRRRFLVSIDDEGREAIQPVPDDATVASRAQWPRLIRDPDFCASPDELRDIMSACFDRMGHMQSSQQQIAQIMRKRAALKPC